MAFINITGQLEITINGQSYGLTCPLDTGVGCCTPNGTYYWYYQGGGIYMCGPTYDYNLGRYVDGNCIGNSKEPEKVYCDPCVNKCCKDCNGNALSYSGEHQWLFNTYIGDSQTISGIKLVEWTVTGGYDGTGTSDCTSSKLCVNGECVCCSAIPEESATVDLGTISKDVTELLKTFTQPYITPGTVDPTEYCNCYCPGCGPTFGGSCGQDIGMIINMMRQEESQKCS